MSEAANAHARSGANPCFRTEADMLSPLTFEAARLLGTRRADSACEVFYEVAAATGVPDMLVVRFDDQAVGQRQRAGCGAIVGASAASAMSTLLEQPHTSEDLARAVGVSLGHLRGAVLPALADSGAVVRHGDLWTAAAEVRPLVQWIVAVEAKRRDWRSALKQSRRYSRFANLSFMALDAGSAAVALRHAADIASMGVGVVTVEALTGNVRVCRRPRWRAAQVRWEAFLVGERLWALASEGRRSGPRFDVFGRTPDPTPDLVLSDALALT